MSVMMAIVVMDSAAEISMNAPLAYAVTHATHRVVSISALTGAALDCCVFISNLVFNISNYYKVLFE